MHKSAGNAIEFNEAAAAIGAEVMRFIYASKNPTSNLNFPHIKQKRGKKGHSGLANEVKRKLLTFWNCYSFYVTYAEVDGISPDMLNVPMEQRSELDRWIVSKFQHLVRFAHKSFEGYRVHNLMERFEQFQDQLSAWYLRRSRRRFWKTGNDTDKLAAFTTLFEMLEGLCRLMAPVLPFLCEEIYQNIVRSVQPDSPESVHLLDYPVYDPALADADLEARIDTVITYKNLALGLRNKNNLKVRQPLRRLLIRPRSAAERQALQAAGMRAQLLEEVNVKDLELAENSESFVQTSAKPNFKTLGPRYGRVMKGIQAYLVEVDVAALQEDLKAGGLHRFDLDGTSVTLTGEDVFLSHAGPEGLAVHLEGDLFVALDTVITSELELEGMARDFVRGVQNHRKDLDLQVSDRIRLRYRAQGKVAQAIEACGDYIANETLAVRITADGELEGGALVKVRGEKVGIAVEVV